MTANPFTSRGQRLRGLDVLRALAITGVYFYHYPKNHFHDWLYRIEQFGGTGVDLFFVLSGFLIAGELFAQIERNERLALRKFYLRRAFRILPAFWTVLALYFLWPGFTEQWGLAPLPKYLFFVQNLGLNLETQRAFSHAWSLCVEAHFYLLIPLVVWAMGPRARRYFPWLVAMILVTGLLTRWLSRSAWQPHPELTFRDRCRYYLLVYYPTYNRMDGIALGSWLAWCFHFKPNLWRSLTERASALLALGGAALVAAYFLSQDKYSMASSLLFYPLCSFSFATWTLASIRWESSFHRSWLVPLFWIAELSYGIYLLHKAVIHLFQSHLLIPLGIDRFSTFSFILTLLAVLLACLALRLAVELPSKAIRNTLIRRSEPA